MLRLRRLFGSPRPIPSRHTKRSQGGSLQRPPKGSTPTTRGAPTSLLRSSGWWIRCPCPCVWRAHAQGRRPSWYGALADLGQGRWRPPPPRWRSTRPITAMSCRPSSPLPSTKRFRLWDTTTWETCTRKTTTSKWNEPLRSGRQPARVCLAWLARHGAVLAPLLRVPPPRW